MDDFDVVLDCPGSSAIGETTADIVNIEIKRSQHFLIRIVVVSPSEKVSRLIVFKLNCANFKDLSLTKIQRAISENSR